MSNRKDIEITDPAQQAPLPQPEPSRRTGNGPGQELHDGHETAGEPHPSTSVGGAIGAAAGAVAGAAAGVVGGPAGIAAGAAAGAALGGGAGIASAAQESESSGTSDNGKRVRRGD